MLLSLVHSGSADQIEIRRSDDRGRSWYRVGAPPAGIRFDDLSPAPLFARWGVLFAYSSEGGTLYRSSDGGTSWQAVLETGLPDSKSGGLVYGADEANRTVYFLAAARAGTRGGLYRSSDGGQTWQARPLPADLKPTVLAGSSDSVDRGVLWLGAIDGRIRSIELAE